MNDLECVSTEEQTNFFKSFDQILCDIDGVLWHFPNVIPGANSAIASLRNLGKNVTFVSNNTTRAHEKVFQHLKLHNFIRIKDDLIMPEVAILAHLKRINFNKDIYYIGLPPIKDALIKSGFKITENHSDLTLTSIPEFFQASTNLSDKVGAVITEINVRMNYLQLQKAANYLKRPDVLFITGNSSSRYLHVGKDKIFNQFANFEYLLEKFSGRKVLRLAKPSSDLKDFIEEKCEVSNPSRILVIGDSVEDDMAFATNCGYQKLLVLSGISRKDALENWTFPENYKPEYYVKDLGALENILQKLK